MTDIGYARVSSVGQTLDQQRDALLAAGIEPDRIYSDMISGVKAARPGLDALLAYAREGDSVTVVRLDRLGRSLSMIFNTIETLEARGIILCSQSEAIDMSTAPGRLMVTMLAGFAQYERELMKERVTEARGAVEARGGRWGRKPALTPRRWP